jgi:hypothetical protein
VVGKKYRMHHAAKELETSVVTIVRMVKMGWLKLDSDKMVSSDQMSKIKKSVEERGSLDAVFDAMAKGLPDGAISMAQARDIIGCSDSTIRIWAVSGRNGIVASGKGVTLDSVLAAKSKWKVREKKLPKSGNCGECGVLLNREGFPDTAAHPESGLCLSCHICAR